MVSFKIIVQGVGNKVILGKNNMGCASSGPIVESGKNLVNAAKENANDVLAKGENALKEVGDTAKEGITTGVGHVKEAVDSAIHTAEEGIQTVVGKIENTFHDTSSKAKETVKNAEETMKETLNKTTDSVTEAVSDAETVLASEVDDVKENLNDVKETVFEKIDTNKNELINETENFLKIEDIDQIYDDIMGDNVKNTKIEAEEIISHSITPIPVIDNKQEEGNNKAIKVEINPSIEEMKEFEENKKKDEKEEPPPTLWEAAADAILLQKMKSGDNINKPFMDVDRDQIISAFLRTKPPSNDFQSVKTINNKENVFFSD